MVFLFATKLDPETRELWEHNVVELPKNPSTGRQLVPSSSFILEFVKKRARTLEHTTNLKLGLTSGSPNKALRMATTKAASITLGRTDPRTEYSGQVDANFTGKNYTQKTSVNKPKDGNKKHFATPLAPKAPCQHCSEAHQIWKCEAFRDAPVAAKLYTVNKARICFNCLASGHASKASQASTHVEFVDYGITLTCTIQLRTTPSATVSLTVTAGRSGRFNIAGTRKQVTVCTMST